MARWIPTRQCCEEGIRLAYVALTRAMNRLYVLDARKADSQGMTVAALTDSWRV